MVRIVLGIIAIVLGAIGLLVGGFLGAMVGGVVSLATISEESTTVVPSGSTVDLESGVYLVGTTSPSATCTATGAESTSQPQPGTITYEVDGTTYHTVLQVTAEKGTQATFTCTGAEVAVAQVGNGPILIGVRVGLALPILLGLIGLVLLISGIVGRVNSGRGQ